ncbi:MAG: isoprenyl transferase [Bacillota bacterium]
MSFFSREEVIEVKDVISKPLPRHIAIIMDGNGRWATKRGLPRVAGHRAGVNTLKRIVETCLELKISFLTVYAFSTENWKRPKDEVNTLMNLIVEYIQSELDILHKNGVKIHPIGFIDELPQFTRDYIKNAAEKTFFNDKLVLNVALNYGGRAEITQGVRNLCQDALDGKFSINDINEKTFSEYLYTKNQPDPDLMIRPSGEMRISNFLLWQLAYTEFWVTNILWPDFKPQHLIKAIYDFQNRNRRYGGINLN